MEPLEVFALTDGMNRASGSIPYISLEWNRKYYECGTFTLEVPSDIYDPSWAYIYSEERPETGIVQKVEYTDDSHVIDGIDTVTISGFFMESLLNRFVFLVEETEQEEYLIPKPVPVSTPKPTLWKDSTGALYERRSGAYYTMDGVRTGIPSDGSASLEQVDLLNGKGVGEVKYPTNNTDKYPDGTWSAGQYKTNYDYYRSSDGKLVNVDHFGAETTYEVVKNSGGSAIYKDEDGNYRWVNGVAANKNSTYTREASEWERLSKSLETSEDGSLIAYRTVKGPWMGKLDLDEVGVKADNVQTVIKWAQRMFGNSILYDEPDFAGELKVIEPSLKYLGDLFFAELQTVEASVRFHYNFESNQMILQVWRGLDRTQSQSKNPFAVFSDTWGTIYDFAASKDLSNYKNKCYTLYEYDIPTAWNANGSPKVETLYEWNETGTSRKLIGYTVPYVSKRGYLIDRLEDGLPDAETYLDMRSEKPECDGEWERDKYPADSPPSMPSGLREQYAAWEQSLKASGISHLKNNYGIISSLDTGTLSSDAYMRDFDLGDKVDMLVEQVGMISETRITGISETYEADGSTIHIEVGDQLLTDTRKAVLAK